MSANETLGLPRNKMETLWYAFDIDGTLRSNTVDQNIAPVANEEIRTLLITLRKYFKNTKIAVWSGSGEIYARQVAASIGIDSYVHKYLSKQDWKDWSEGKNVRAVDDIQDTAIGNNGNLIVRLK